MLVVHTQDMEEVRFYFDRESAQFRLITGIGVMVITSLPQAVIAYQNPDLRGWVISVLFGAVLIYYFLLRQLWFFYTTKSPGIVLNSEGIWDHRNRNGRGFVPWGQVLSCKNCGNGSVRIFVQQPVSNDTPGMLGSLKLALRGKPQIHIYSGLLSATPAEIVFKINTFLKAANDSQPTG